MSDDAPVASNAPEPTPTAALVPAKPVERLFPFVLRARILFVGREILRHKKSKLHFVLITRDLAEASRAQILSDFVHYPVVQHYTPEDLEKFFGIRGAKVIGFAKSGLAQSIYAQLKEHRINQPVVKPKPAEPPPTPPSARKAAPGFPSRRPGRF